MRTNHAEVFEHFVVRLPKKISDASLGGHERGRETPMRESFRMRSQAGARHRVRGSNAMKNNE